MNKISLAVTVLNGLFFTGSLGLSPIAPPAMAQFLATTFNITNRTDVGFAAVAVVAPNDPTKVMAFDIAPGVNAVENADSGWAWVDPCDKDPRLMPPNAPIACARMGLKTGWAEFGAVNYNGAPRHNIRFRIGPHTVGEVTIDPVNGDPVWTIKGRVKARGFDIIP